LSYRPEGLLGMLGA